MGRREQALVGQGLMDRTGHLNILFWSWRCLDIRNQVGQLRLARFRQMDSIADPGGRSLLGEARLRIIGRIDVQLGRRQVSLIVLICTRHSRLNVYQA